MDIFNRSHIKNEVEKSTSFLLFSEALVKFEQKTVKQPQNNVTRGIGDKKSRVHAVALHILIKLLAMVLLLLLNMRESIAEGGT